MAYGPGNTAGDMARRLALALSGAQVIIAAADGATAAVVIDRELLYAN